MAYPAFTTQQYQILLLQEVHYPDGHPINLILPSVWQLYQDKAVQEPRLQYLYAKRALLAAIIQHQWEDVHFHEAEAEENDEQRTTNLQQSWKNVDAEITASEKRLRANRSGIVGAMLQTATIMPDNICEWNPNGRVFRGDPLRRMINGPQS
jgi:hypothetical protein